MTWAQVSWLWALPLMRALPSIRFLFCLPGPLPLLARLAPVKR